jgi:hypothetical protein
MNMLMHASKAAMANEDASEDDVDHMITLRSCILQVRRALGVDLPSHTGGVNPSLPLLPYSRRGLSCQAYAGILQGMDSKATLLQPFAESIVTLVAAIAATDEEHFDVELSVETLGVLVDLLCAFDTVCAPARYRETLSPCRNSLGSREPWPLAHAPAWY